MTDRESTRRLGSLIPMLLFILFFVACSGVLAAVLIRSAQISADAGSRSDAVQLCRNQAERFRGGQTIAEGKQFYHADFTPASPESGEYTLEVTCSREGSLTTAHITCSSLEGTVLYELDAVRYALEGRQP